MTATEPRRSLILAGGGMKVAYQAGVLQVWLDEAGLRFDHVDGASGGTFNLAMMCQDYSGTRIADAWRATSPARGVTPAWSQLWRLPFATSLMTLDGYRRSVFPGWGLDFAAIRRSTLDATFNRYNVTRQRLEVVEPAGMDEDVLASCVSLATWFPPVQDRGETFVDAVYVTDANVEEALDRGADEIWIIWTVSMRGDWDPGPIAQYFGTIEASANGALARALDRIERNNAARAAGGPGELGRHVEVRMLQAEVPLHYLVVLGDDRLHLAVERGVADARAWCEEHGVPLKPATEPTPAEDPTGLRFTETMRGHVVDPTDPDRRPDDLAMTVTVATADLDRFVTDPRHRATLTGTVTSPLLGGERAIDSGTLDLLADDGDPHAKVMRYRLHLHDAQGEAITVDGVKSVDSGRLSRLWSETTTLDTHVRRAAPEDGVDGALLAAGTLHLGALDLLRQLTTFRASGSSPGRRAGAYVRFATMFAGHLWDVYARPVLSYSPV